VDPIDREIFGALFGNDRDPDVRSSLRVLVDQHGVDVLNEVRDNRLDGLLQRAVRNDDPDRTAALLDAGLNPNEHWLDDSPLHLAAQTNQEADLVQLLAHVADVSATNRRGQTALHVAAAWGSTSAMQNLLDHRALIDAVDTNGNTPLARAVQEGQRDNVRFLLDRDADPALAKRGTAWRFAQAHVAQRGGASRRRDESAFNVRECMGLVLEHEKRALRQAMVGAPAQASAPRRRMRL